MYGSQTKKTIIALDFDDTITKEPLFFKSIIEQFKHNIEFYIVTYRSQNAYDDLLKEFEELTEHKVIFTDAKAKCDFLDADIWIDDTPMAVTHNWLSYGYKIAESLESEIVKPLSPKCLYCKWFNVDESIDPNTKRLLKIVEQIDKELEGAK